MLLRVVRHAEPIIHLHLRRVHRNGYVIGSVRNASHDTFRCTFKEGVAPAQRFTRLPESADIPSERILPSRKHRNKLEPYKGPVYNEGNQQGGRKPDITAYLN